MSETLEWICNGDAEEAVNTPGWRIVVTPVGDIVDDQNWAFIKSTDGNVTIDGPGYTLPVAHAKRWCEIVWSSGACRSLDATMAKLAAALQ